MLKIKYFTSLLLFLINFLKNILKTFTGWKIQRSPTAILTISFSTWVTTLLTAYYLLCHFYQVHWFVEGFANIEFKIDISV